MTAPCTAGGAAWGVIPISLKIDVKLGSEALDDTCDPGAGGVVRPKIAVNSPTVFFGGSMGWEENPGISAGLSP